jgi:hypothetical protein
VHHTPPASGRGTSSAPEEELLQHPTPPPPHNINMVSVIYSVKLVIWSQYFRVKERERERESGKNIRKNSPPGVESARKLFPSLLPSPDSYKNPIPRSPLLFSDTEKNDQDKMLTALRLLRSLTFGAVFLIGRDCSQSEIAAACAWGPFKEAAQ